MQIIQNYLPGCMSALKIRLTLPTTLEKHILCLSQHACIPQNQSGFQIHLEVELREWEST